MSLSLARLDVTQIFCDVDDVYRELEQFCERDIARLPWDEPPKGYPSRLSISEVMTIVIAFHASGYRTFKDFYQQLVLVHWRDAFPMLVSYGRFVELMPWSFVALVQVLNSRCFGTMTGISFLDATSISVCHVKRAKAHKTFNHLAGWGKSSMGWYFGFKLHLIINERGNERDNERGELLAATLTPGNTDDRKPVPEMTQGLLSKLFGDRGYISQALFETLFNRGLELITKRRKTMKNSLMPHINSQLPSNEVIEQALRRTVPMYPELAVLELVANALIHQDFSIGGTGPMVEIFEDRMEVTNPGSPLVDTDRFLDSPPKSRNKTLAALMRRMGICEERGSGVDKVVSQTEFYQLPAPIFEVSGDNTRAILLPPPPPE